MDTLHSRYLDAIRRFVDPARVYTDPLYTYAWGTDASFYRLVPQIVVRARDEAEVARLVGLADSMGVRVTFRAAGTSLSGQSVSDSVLIVAGREWDSYTVGPAAETITMQPGLIGRSVNAILQPYRRMFSPDPASINSAMIGGIVSNNASGMSCGTHANSDRVLRSIRIVMADGTVLDTGSDDSRKAFSAARPDFVAAIAKLRDDILADTELADRIRFKYSIKNVTGLNLRPFVTYTDPFDIIAHCMVGSEGTLGFISEVTMETRPLLPFKASAMVYFDDLSEACKAIVALRDAPVVSAEMFDSKSLRSVNDPTGTGLTAVLTETQAETAEELKANCDRIVALLSGFRLFRTVEFTDDPKVYSKYWEMRAGIFPSVGGTRPAGTTVLIEDVAFHIEDLPEATVALQQLLVDAGYDDACIYGHALAGNYHFIISQSFDTEADVARYKNLMQQVEKLVVGRFDGSLKAEHGTGRNMAPFVAREWGDKAYEAMKRLKSIFDSRGTLNPGVIFNDDPDCYVRHLKKMPATDPEVDRCIECGFCEVNCVSWGLTLSSRQRIALQREMSLLRSRGDDPDLLARLEKAYVYPGIETCAADGLCSTSCPMGINTAEMTHRLRQQRAPEGSMIYRAGNFAARHLAGVEAGLRPVLSVASAVKSVIGGKAVIAVGRTLHHVGFPLWTSALPKAVYPHTPETVRSDRKVVYFPSCINRTMGVTTGKGFSSEPLVDVVVRLLRKAGWEVIFPEGMADLCCGMIWSSKGMPDIAARKTAETEQALLKASDGGRYPVISDQSPCLHHLRQHVSSLRLYELTEFVADKVADSLVFNPVDEPVALHITCSSRLMGLASKMVALASRCSRHVLVPTGIGCCGFAGDRGFTRPELNAWALRDLRRQITEHDITRGFSNSRTCEIGLTANSGIPYQSLIYLVDEVTVPK